MTTFNDDCWSVIFLQLALSDQLVCRRVNRKFYRLINRHIIPTITYIRHPLDVNFVQLLLGSSFHQLTFNLIDCSTRKPPPGQEEDLIAQMHRLLLSKVKYIISDRFPIIYQDKVTTIRQNRHEAYYINEATFNYPQLVELRAGCLTDALLMKIPQLRKLTLYPSPNVTYQGLASLTNLTCLTLHQYPGPTDFPTLTRLRQLKIK